MRLEPVAWAALIEQGRGFLVAALLLRARNLNRRIDYFARKDNGANFEDPQIHSEMI